MKQKLCFLVLTFLIGYQTLGQILLGTTEENNGEMTIKESLTDLSVSQNFSFLKVEQVNHEYQIFNKLYMGKDFVYTNKIAEAELPIYSYLIEVPICDDIVIEENATNLETFSLENGYRIFPSQVSQSKQNEEVPFQMNEDYYSQNTSNPQKRVRVDVIGIMNGTRIAKVSVSPVKYNPQSNIIEIAKQLDYTIKFINPNYTATQSLKAKTNSLSTGFISNKIVNPKNLSASVHSTNINRPYKMVIVSDRMFEESLQPFIQWKTQQGFEIIALYTDEIGNTTTAIKNHLRSLWDEATESNPAPDYLLLCGDINKIPTFDGENTGGTSGHPTDLYYAEYTGDILPELFYGRFSATSSSQMTAIVNKTVNYEKYGFENDEFLNRVLLVAGKETASPAPTCVNGQMNYVKQYFDGLDTSVYYNPASGNKSTEIRQKINNGQGWINYSAHCDETGWYSPSFTTSNISSMSNTGMYGVFLNNCCLSSRYNVSECFAEKLLRASDEGGVAIIGGSNYTYWYEDYYWSVGAKNVVLNPNYSSSALGAYDRMFHTHSESFDKWYTTVGQMIQAGNLAVDLANSSRSEYYWEVYNLMGDPSLVPFVGIAQTFDVELPQNLPLGTSEITLENLPPYTYVGLSSNNTLITAAQADANGSVSLSFEPISENSNIMVVLTNQFYRPMISEISIATPNEPYIILSDIKFEDASNGEIVDKLQADKEYNIHLNAQNIGLNPLNNTVIHIEWLENVTVISDYHLNIGTMNPQTSIPCNNIFKIRTHEALANNLELNFSILVDGTDYQSNKIVKKKIEAPVLDIKNIRIKQGTNGKEIEFNVCNDGAIAASEGAVSIESRSTNISFEENATLNIIPLVANQFTTASFDCTVSDEENIEFAITYTAGHYSITKLVNMATQSTIETFESNSLPQEWQNDNSAAWFIDNTTAYEGNYSLRSGDIEDNETTSIEIITEAVYRDTISFYVKVSSENNYDFFKFYLDGEEKVSLSGSSSDWQQKKYVINAGTHTLKFEYSKDYSNSTGQDAAWVDNLRLPVKSSVTGLGDIIVSDLTATPNPADKQIRLSGLPSHGELFIFDMNGKMMLRTNLTNSNSMLVDLENIPTGTYVICVKSEDGIITEKLIIAR